VSERRPVLLLILDGWGLGEDPSNSAIEQANTPVWHGIWEKYPRTKLVPYGESVGLSEGQMGNSEVGHLNLGAGRVVYQDLVAITKLIDSGGLAKHERLNTFLDGVGEGTLHFVGLFSDGGVHSHIDHLIGLANYVASRAAQDAAPTTMCIHALLDGRDTPPAIAEQYFEYSQSRLPQGVSFATLGGRYFGMDRDKRWQRTKRAWDAIVHARGAWAADWQSAMAQARRWGSTDEFVAPTVLDGYQGMQPGDSVICFNFRADRMRQLVEAFLNGSVEAAAGRPEDGGKLPPPQSVKPRVFTFTHYRDDFNIPVLLTYEPVEQTLAQVCSEAGLKVYKGAETEKYAHVTYFFNGGREEPWDGEERVLVPSPKVATYDLKPQMSVYEVTDKLAAAIESGEHDVLVVNYANGDMVGHTGVIPAEIKACEAVDECLGKVLEAAQWGKRCAVIVTADHGNCDVMRWPDGTPHTQHSMNLVPVVLVSEPRIELCSFEEEPKKHGQLDEHIEEGQERAGEPIENGEARPETWSLCDIAPTILDLLGVKKPKSWTGISLLKR
jgi:2,3-bisphosphoglycerate-independent phosphoglycerate mutase